MTIATAMIRFDWRKPRLTKFDLLRMLITGTAWGLAMSAGFAGMTLWNYGMVCSDDVVLTTAISVAAGIFAIGPIAAFGRR